MSNDTEIAEREQRVREIIGRLESDTLSLAEAKELRDEAREHIDALRGLIDGEDGDVELIERGDDRGGSGDAVDDSRLITDVEPGSSQ